MAPTWKVPKVDPEVQHRLVPRVGATVGAFLKNLSHHPDTWPIGIALGVASAALVFTSYHMTMTNPDVYISAASKTGFAPIDQEDHMAEQAVAHHDRSVFYRIANLRRDDKNLMHGGYDTNIRWNPFSAIGSKRYEFWRAHPGLSGSLLYLVPGAVYGLAASAAYIALDQMWGPLIPHKYHPHPHPAGAHGDSHGHGGHGEKGHH